MKFLKNALWHTLAYTVSRPLVANWIIKKAKKTPYSPIYRAGSDLIYMDRWWLFNPYGKTSEGRTAPARWHWLPSIRVHHIALRDDDQHEHDHPWEARTIILRGWYMENRTVHGLRSRVMRQGMTDTISAGQFHRISHVSDDGAYTLFFTWRFIEQWGFNVDGKKIPWRTYLGLDKS